MKRTAITHEFVEGMPETMEEGVLYVSIRYRTAAHLCACGCGSKVVTPIRPARWQLEYDGESVSLTPSIGNWQKPCRSHYWIRNDRIEWAREWSDEEIAAGRKRDNELLRASFKSEGSTGMQTSRTEATVTSRFRQMIRRLWPF